MITTKEALTPIVEVAGILLVVIGVLMILVYIVGSRLIKRLIKNDP